MLKITPKIKEIISAPIWRIPKEIDSPTGKTSSTISSLRIGMVGVYPKAIKKLVIAKLVI